jgi:two-component system sensor histidine kinase PilS (NtrC family)
MALRSQAPVPVVGPGLGAPVASLLPPPLTTGDDDESRAVRRLHLFMATRLGVATLLLGGTLLIAVDDATGFSSFTPRFLGVLIGAIYGFSLLYAIWLLKAGNRDRVALGQVACDLLVTTGLVYVTGGAGSGFTFLYGVAVLMAAMVVGPNSARVTGVAAVLCYGALVAGLAGGHIPPPSDQSMEAYVLPITELAYAALMNVMGLLLVTLLASNLSARLLSAGGRIAAAEASAATLARLNDDIVRSLSSGLLTTDLNGKVRTINRTGADMFGSSADRLVGTDVSSLLPVSATQLAQARGMSLIRVEGEAKRQDGSTFPVGFSVSPLITLDEAPVGSLLLFQDLTEIAQLRVAAERAERLAVLGRLSAGLAHEIRNPLGSISGSVELVRESAALDEEDRNLLTIVLTEVDRLNDLVTTMLQVGKPREPRRQQEDLRNVVVAVVEMAQRGAAATQGIRILSELPSQPVFVWADGDQIRQVLWNLVKNALQASPRGSLIVVRANADPEGNGVLEVIDQGDGLTQHQMKRVYDMFHSERTHGAGIGLALVRQIVDAHGGQIEIKSEQKKGATFIVTLPGRAPSSVS